MSATNQTASAVIVGVLRHSMTIINDVYDDGSGNVTIVLGGESENADHEDA